MTHPINSGLATQSVSSSKAKGFPPPPALTPATLSTINKPLAAMPGSVNAPTISINKTWVLPPKPKPGRKPAVDPPPTKRKAQNREAQRAFRERRAAKVGDLEEEMKKMEDENTRDQEVLTTRISQLEKSVEEYGDLVESWRSKFVEMQIACGREKQLKEQVEAEMMALRESLSCGTEAIPLPRPNTRGKKYLDRQQSNDSYNVITDRQEIEDLNHNSLTCGNCSRDTRCQCIEEAFEMSNITDETPEQTSKRPHSPPSDTNNKRVCSDSTVEESTEIDFTAKFSSRGPPALVGSTSTASSSIPAIAPLDPCGFCQDGSPCICSELAKDLSQHQDMKPSIVPLKPLTLEQRTVKLPQQNSNPCINGPGTCAQCLSNPTSTLFCKSVAAANRPAASFDKPPNSQPAIPSTTNPTFTPTSSSAPAQSTRLTCADAFTTLSRHPGFSAATDELNTWVPQLTAVPKHSSTTPERTAFDIEAASVMSVLKFFDRRFGKDGNDVHEACMS